MVKPFSTKTVLVVLLLGTVFSYVNATINLRSAPIEVKSLSESSLAWTVRSGVRVSGSVLINGGSNNDIDFWITDPEGVEVIDFGRVSGRKSFQFTTSKSGAYTFHFSNTFSSLSSKTVTLVRYDPPLHLNIDDGPSLLLGILVVVLVVLVVSLFVYSRRTRRSETAQPID